MAYRTLEATHEDVKKYIAGIVGVPAEIIGEYVICIRTHEDSHFHHGIISNLMDSEDVGQLMVSSLATKLGNEMDNKDDYPYRR